MSGTLYICATPIGNMEDMTLRAVRILKEVDLIAAEDTRNSRKLLDRYEIHTPVTSYHEHNKMEKGRQLLDKLKEGQSIALISDAGMPVISDPGYELVNSAHEEGVSVTVLPGACAAPAALALSGLKNESFTFEGFLPVKAKDRSGRLAGLKTERRTMIFYEAPHRLVRTLSDLKDELGGERRAAVVRELTKKHEDLKRGSLYELLAFYKENEPKGECVIIAEGISRDDEKLCRALQWENISIPEHVNIYLDRGMDKKEAMRQAASDRGVSRREIYEALLDKQEES